jgi:hypothetical protein
MGKESNMAKNKHTVACVLQAMLDLIDISDDVLDMLVDGRAKLTVEILRRLKSTTSLAIAGNTINPCDFFNTRKGLRTSSNFNNFILSGASEKEVSANKATISYADLAQAANDGEIGGELPEGYVFEDVDVFLAHLAALIECQWDGKEGALLNNGYANIFYVKVNGAVFAVRVNWYADHRKWLCFASRLDDFRWDAGDRAFSATATQT